MITKVITYQTPEGLSINLTPKQVAVLEAAGKWPKDSKGREYCNVGFGLHVGTPTCDTDLLSDLLDVG